MYTAFNKKTLFTSKFDLNLMKKRVKCYIWSVILYSAETSTLRKVNKRYLKILNCGGGGGWEISFGPIM